ncbi:MAG: periplasmic heavy metal sensor [Polyangiales bacterium]
MIRMRWQLALTPAVVLLAMGCGGGTPAATSPGGGSSDVVQAAPAVDVEDESTADLAAHHRHHHHGGFAMFIAMSLDSLGFSPEQEVAIKKIQADLHSKMSPAHQAEKAVILALADGIAAGAIDKAKIDAAMATLATAAAGVHDAVADSLNELHAALTPAQRIALVDKVEAHFAVWHHHNVTEETAEKDKKGGHLGKLAKELGLSTDQVEKIRESFKTSSGGARKFDKDEAEAHLKAFGAAFVSDKFDAKTVVTGGPAGAHLATFGAERMVRFYTAVLPQLTPEQRTKLADDLRRHASYKRSSSEK